MTDKPDNTTSELIEELKAVIKMIGRMCKEGTPPKMSIPARPEEDEDLLIVATVDKAITALESSQQEKTAISRKALAHAEELQAKLAASEARVKELENTIVTYYRAAEDQDTLGDAYADLIACAQSLDKEET